MYSLCPRAFMFPVLAAVRDESSSPDPRRPADRSVFSEPPERNVLARIGGLHPVKLAQKFLAAVGHPGRRDNPDADIVIAGSASAEMRHALALELELLAGLHALRQGQHDHAVHGRDLDLVAHDGFLHRHLRLGIEIVALPLEIMMRLHPRDNIDVAGRSALHTRPAHAGDPDAGSVVHARRYLYIDALRP